MDIIRNLDNGRTVRRGERGRLWLYDPDGQLIGEIERNSLASQLLALTPADFGDVPAESSPEFVAGPVSPPKPQIDLAGRASFRERIKASIRRMLGRA